MRKFLIGFLIFFLPILSIGVGMEWALRRIPNDYVLKKEYLDSHAKDIDFLVLGSSHSYYGVNPKYFENVGFNASHPAQSLNYDFEILKKYENKFVKLKTVILPISYFSLFGKLDTGTEAWRVKNYVIYYEMNSAHSISDYTEIFSNKFEVNLKRLKSYYAEGKSGIQCSDLGWGLNYYSSKALNLEETGMTSAKRHTKKDHQYLNENIATLKSIIEFCQKRNIKVLLFTPPAFEYYRNNLNETQLKLTIENANRMANSFNNCRYVNLLEDSSFKAQDFYDADHLNEIGAEKLSLLLNKMIAE